MKNYLKCVFILFLLGSIATTLPAQSTQEPLRKSGFFGRYWQGDKKLSAKEMDALFRASNNPEAQQLWKQGKAFSLASSGASAIGGAWMLINSLRISKGEDASLGAPLIVMGGSIPLAIFSGNKIKKAVQNYNLGLNRTK